MKTSTLIRLAAFLILVSQAIAFILAMNFTGRTAILFSFVGHPFAVAGLALTAYITLLRTRRERD
jgi:H+/gluconate symporter-like permease